MHAAASVVTFLAHQAPLYVGGKNTGVGWPYLPNPGTEPTSLISPALAGRFFTTSASWKETEPVNSKGNILKSLDAEAEAPIHWPPDMKSQLIGKNPDDGKDWKLKDKGTAQDEMVR